MKGLATAMALAALIGAVPRVASASPPIAPGPLSDDYPTAARADYVLACMAVNGGTPQALQNCSCSIDVIATVLPYDDYVTAETIMRMRQLGGGYMASEFRTASSSQTLRLLQEAQAEAEMRCF